MLQRFNSPFVLLTSLELFLAFIQLKPHYNSAVNKLASASLGVYLIHTNEILYPYLWQVLLKNPEMYHSRFLLLHAIACTILVYVSCSAIDLLRQGTIERLFMNRVHKKLEKRMEDEKSR
jgi:hypothetical protein